MILKNTYIMQHGAITESKSGNETEAVSLNYFGILHN